MREGKRKTRRIANNEWRQRKIYKEEQNEREKLG